MVIEKMTNAGDDYLICDFRGIYEPVSIQGLMQIYKNMNIVFLHTSEDSDAEIRVFHPSGRELETSAGAIMCTAVYLTTKGGLTGPKVFIKSKSMNHTAFIYPENYPEEGILLELAAPKLHRDDFNIQWKEPFLINEVFFLDSREICLTCVYVGQPYVIVFCEDLQNFPLEETAQALREKYIVPENTGFIAAHVSGAVNMEIRIWDPLQGEKSASGNGAAAAVTAAILNKTTARNVTVACQGGNFVLHILAWTNHVMITGKCGK